MYNALFICFFYIELIFKSFLAAYFLMLKIISNPKNYYLKLKSLAFSTNVDDSSLSGSENIYTYLPRLFKLFLSLNRRSPKEYEIELLPYYLIRSKNFLSGKSLFLNPKPILVRFNSFFSNSLFIYTSYSPSIFKIKLSKSSHLIFSPLTKEKITTLYDNVRNLDNASFDNIFSEHELDQHELIQLIYKLKFEGCIFFGELKQDRFIFYREILDRFHLPIDFYSIPGPEGTTKNFYFVRNNNLDLSLNDIATKMKKYLDFNGGVYIEAGSYDGLSQSNTFHLEKYQNWTGLLIEPINHKFRQCRINRPGSNVYNNFLTYKRPKATTDIVFNGLMTTTKALTEPDRLIAGLSMQKLKRPYKISAINKSLSSIILDSGFKKIDFMSLDVEGSELEVLKSLDFTKFRPKYLLVEVISSSRVSVLKKFLSFYYIFVDKITIHDYLFESKK